jgi:hypothetical protein
MAIFDQAARYLIKLEPAGFLRWQVPGLHDALHFERWQDTRTIPFPGEPDRHCDTVAELTSAGGSGPPWLLVLEVQTRPDPDIAERMLEYMARLRREVRHGPHGRDKYPVAAAVLNLTGNPSAAVLEMALPAEAGIGLNWRMASKGLAAESAPALLDAIASGEQGRCLLPWVPLTAGGDQPEVLARWKELAGQEPSARRRGEYGGLAQIFANLARCLDPWKQALEGWNVEECEIVKEWEEQGRQRGLQQGRQEGRQEGQLENMRRVFLHVFEQRFPGAVPADLAAAAQAQTDVSTLMRWMDLLLTVASPDQLRAALQS